MLQTGSGPGQFSLSGNQILFEGTSIGTFSGGNGSAFSVTFNANANTRAVGALIDDLTFADTAATPSSQRTLTLVATDAAAASSGPHSLVVDIDKLPVLSGIPASTPSNQSAPIVLAPAATASDADDTVLASATVHISAGSFAGNGDLLTANTSGTSINGSYDSASETLTLLGSDTLAHYNQVLDSVAYQSTTNNPSNSGANPTRTVDWQVSDGLAVSTIVSETLNVPPTFNHAPVISSNGGGDTASTSISENTTAVTTVVATDPDGDALTYSIVGGADQGKFQINGASGALSFVTAPDFENPTDSDHNNSYFVQVQASDGTLADQQTITVNVTDVAEGGGNHAPAITSNGGGDTASVSISENTTAVTTVAATDPDSDALTYSIVGGSDAAKFQINATSGALTFVTAPDFENPTDADHNNSYIVQVHASDGSLSDDQLITVGVTDVDEGIRTVHWTRSVLIAPHPAGSLPAGIGDFDADGTSDLAWFNSATGNIDIWKLSDGGWAGSFIVGSHPAGYQPVGFGDYNHDGTSDVLWFNPTTRDVDLWKIVNGQWAGSVDIGTHPAGFQPALTGDFNGDGTSDIAWYNPATNAIDIWKIANGQWAGSVDVGHHPAGYQPLAAADFNLDGSSDIAWYNPTTNNIDIWLMKNGQWAASVDVGSHPGGWTAVGVGDFDHNGVSDIMWRDTATGFIDNWMLALS